MAKHATMALAWLLREPAGADALLGAATCRAAPGGLAAAMRARLCSADAREPVLLAALEVRTPIYIAWLLSAIKHEECIQEKASQIVKKSVTHCEARLRRGGASCGR